MKQIILKISLFAALLFSASLVNAQIPNNGFEQWALDPYGNLNPVGWETTNDGTDLSVEQYTPAKVGNFAIRVKTFDPGFMTLPGIAFSSFAFNQRPYLFSGWVKADIVPGDAVYVIVSMSNGDSLVASPDSCTFIIDTTISEYTRFSYKLRYISPLTPDSAHIMIVAGKSGAVSPGTAIILDELAFESGVGTNDKSMVKPLLAGSVYPNPATERIFFPIELQKSSDLFIEVFNGSGMRVKSYRNRLTGPGSNVVEMPLKDLPGGLYSYRISTDYGQQSGSFTIFH